MNCPCHIIRKTVLLCCTAVVLLLCSHSYAENGYDLWLRYQKIENASVRQNYIPLFSNISISSKSPSANAAKYELNLAIPRLLGIQPIFVNQPGNKPALIAGTTSDVLIKSLLVNDEISALGEEGFLIASKKYKGNNIIIVTGNTDKAVLYGVFNLLRQMQTEQSLANIHFSSTPKIKLRLLNHWDNLNRTVERGYAGFSIWNWHTLPSYIDQRYIDYARANASIGINGTVLTNVNASATVLTKPYLEKVKALADIFRSYGIKVYLTARFSAPVEIGGLKTADPTDTQVKEWWKNKADEIYSLIPDFGGFLVKANSEGQPGPQNYGKTHADGANMLADAVSAHGGIIMWRAFVYSSEVPDDRHKQAYNEFVPLDGKFRANVMVQVKNGPIDFMPREPFHPVFGAMPKTPLMMEFQVTQEYLGQGTHLVYLAPLFKECLGSDTYSSGSGSTVAKIIDGGLDHHTLSGMAGVANIGNDIDWCGHPFAQANWYALGRLSWDYDLSSAQIAEEWLRMTFTNDAGFVKDVKQMMLASREILVKYMNPLGLHHIMATGHHYGPGPWVNNLQRADWNPVYYHKADSAGIGFNRTATGSNALSQYNIAAAKHWNDTINYDEKYMLWFHHVPWNHVMKSGRTLWNELCYEYYNGADSVKWMQLVWSQQKNKIDAERYKQVAMLLAIQEKEAVWWRNACLLYFQTFSGMPIPSGYEKPDQTLEYYKKLSFSFTPGNPG